jgi:hypothetical protein
VQFAGFETFELLAIRDAEVVSNRVRFSTFGLYWWRTCDARPHRGIATPQSASPLRSSRLLLIVTDQFSVE